MYLMLEIISWYILDLNDVLQQLKQIYGRVVLDHSKCYE
jgi:hypothetical protein